MAARLMKEYQALQKEPAEDIVLFPCNESNIFHWRGFITGPPETPYEGGTFELDINVPENYPLQPPTILFLTKVFHPNIHFKTGEICLDLLKTAWSAVYTLQSVCRSIIALLAHPEPDSPLNCDCGNLLRIGDVRGYNSLARMYTLLYASPTSSSSSSS
ncbi:E2 ubiquitin-protein ligase peroxin 4 [Balamuthia mandrillaris]